VILKEDLPGTVFIKGDKATVVEIYSANEAYELEFYNKDGQTLGVETITAFNDGQSTVKVIWKNPINNE
jgi:hypothetical protein